MLDSPDGVCAGQAGFEYPATSVPFSKRARQPVPGPAAQHRKQSSTWSFTCRGYPLLTRGCRRSVPPVCPTFQSSVRSAAKLAVSFGMSRAGRPSARASQQIMWCV